MAFIDLIWFGHELSYNPKPIIGGVFWFDLNDLTEVHEFSHYCNRGIHEVNINKKSRSIRIQFLDEPHDKIEFRFGPEATFQFITSRSLDGVTLERR